MSVTLTSPVSKVTLTPHGVSEPPEQLAKFIAIVNAEHWYECRPFNPKDLIALARSMNSLNIALEKVKSLSPTKGECGEPTALHLETLSRAKVRKMYAAIASALSPEARAFVETADLNNFPQEYDLLLQARTLLLAIAGRNSKNAQVAKLLEAGEEVYDEYLHYFIPGSKVTVHIIVGEDGCLAARPNPLLSALIGVRADRIRLCAVCSQLFWARRSNSQCCGNKCRNVYNQRNRRKSKKNPRKTKNKARCESKKGL